MPRSLSRSMFAVAVLAAALATTVPAAGAAAGSARTAKPVHRIGGKVHTAWPAKGHKAPKTALARWLARQVGPRKVLVCSKRPARARARCVRNRSHAVGALAHTSAVASPSLQLVRSFDIPPEDPAYDRLLNWSWTYDSAVSAAAFVATGERVESVRLLDQIAALQRKDGTIETAFNVETGETSGQIRAGTMAWIGLAMVASDGASSDAKHYLYNERLAASALLALRGDDGLVRGGPDVTWVSTQHNLIAHAFLAALSAHLRDLGDTSGAAAYGTAADTIAKAIDAKLIVRTDDGLAHFLQGSGDPVEALDVQALGVGYLLGRGDPETAKRVYAYAQQTFGVEDRSIDLSADPDHYNVRYEAPGPFSGYRPYSGKGAPDVVWFEGTAEMRLAQAAIGEDTSALDDSIARWWKVTRGDGLAPLGANRTMSSAGFNSEYHVWPTAAAGAWTVLAQAAPKFFAVPRATDDTVVNDWSKIRETSPMIVYPDGSVDMTSLKSGGGERRVLSPTNFGADMTVTADATMTSSTAPVGWALMLRTTTDSKNNVTGGYALQVDKGFAQLVLRARGTNTSGSEYESPPLARVNMPAGFDWYARTRLIVTIKGNTLTASVNGTTLMTVPDLAAAADAAAKAGSFTGGSLIAAGPGHVAVRIWSTTQLQLHQVVVSPAG